MAYFSKKEIQERRAELLDRIDAILAMCKEEGREPTEEETKEIDTCVAEGESLVDQEARADKIEAQRIRISAARSAGPQASVDGPQAKLEKPKAPAIPRHHHNLNAFRGENAEQDAHDSGMWLRAFFDHDPHARQYCQDRGIGGILADGQTADDMSRGGLFVPSQLSNAIISVLTDKGIARRLSTVIPMTSETLDISRRSSGLTVYSPAEQTAITTSEAQWNRVSLTVRDRATLTRISRKLLRSSAISVADMIASEIGYAFSSQMDSEFIDGDGTSQYFQEVGLVSALGAAGIKTGTTTSEDTWAEMTLTNFHDTMALLPSKWWSYGPSWVCSAPFYHSVMQRLASAASGNTIGTLQQGMSGNSFPMAGGSFLGYPVYFTDDMPTSTAVSTVQVLFGAFSQAVLLGDRVGVEVSTSEHRYFDSDEIAIRGKIAYDINVYESGDASNAGAYVAWKTGAAS